MVKVPFGAVWCCLVLPAACEELLHQEIKDVLRPASAQRAVFFCTAAIENLFI